MLSFRNWNHVRSGERFSSLARTHERKNPQPKKFLGRPGAEDFPRVARVLEPVAEFRSSASARQFAWDSGAGRGGWQRLFLCVRRPQYMVAVAEVHDRVLGDKDNKLWVQ